MSAVAFFVTWLALAGAVASWVAGAYFYLRTLQAADSGGADTRLKWILLIAWPFAIGRLKGAAAAYAAKVNKALVAFLVCLMVAATAFALAANLARVSR